MTYYTRNRKKKRRTRKNKKNKRKETKYPSMVFGHISMEGCHHCKNMEDDWSHLCARVKKKTPSFLLYDIAEDHQNKIDVFNRKYSTNLEYTGVPTIFKLRLQGGKMNMEYYEGERTQSYMEKWLYGEK